MSQSQDVSASPSSAAADPVGAPTPIGAAAAPANLAADPVGVVADHPHDFDVQKELHQKIRNDPDYDDWEYGTEPLPHEAWVSRPDQPAP